MIEQTSMIEKIVSCWMNYKLKMKEPKLINLKVDMLLQPKTCFNRYKGLYDKRETIINAFKNKNIVPGNLQTKYEPEFEEKVDD